MHNSVLFPIVLSASTFLSYSALAACTANPDCAALGYTKSSCPSGDLVLRCPFNTAKVNCIPQTCETIGKKTCGDYCIKVSSCCSDSDCAAGQKCDTEEQTCQTICAVGDIYYSDKTCSSTYNSSKKAIGVVGHITNSGKNGVVMALDSEYDNKFNLGRQWGCIDTDLSLTNYPDQTSAKTDFSGKTNTETIMKECSNSFIAARYCNEYSKEGVSGWYLPAYGELYAILYTNFSTVNTGLGKISSNNKITHGYWYWSSSENHSVSAWGITANKSEASVGNKDNKNLSTRCVLAF